MKYFLFFLFFLENKYGCFSCKTGSKCKKNKKYVHVFGNQTDGKISGKLNFQTVGIENNDENLEINNKHKMPKNKTWKIWIFRTKRHSLVPAPMSDCIT